MRILADMGVSQGVTAWLREQGHDVVHLRDEGLQCLPNGEIFVKATAERRVILTFDLDFAEIVALSDRQIVSVLLFRLKNTRTPFVIRRLGVVMPATMKALEKGAIVVLEDGRHRIRQLPLGS